MKHSFIIAFLMSMIIIMPLTVEAKHHHSQQYQEQTADLSSDLYSDEELQASIDSVLADTAKSQPEIKKFEWAEEFGDAVKNCVSELEEDSSWFGLFKFALKGILLLISILFILIAIIYIPYILVVWLVARFVYHKRHNIMQGFHDLENDYNNISSANPQTAGEYNVDAEQNANKAKYMHYWERGIKITGLGIGLFLAGLIWNINLVMGLGALIACYGLSQIYISQKYKE